MGEVGDSSATVDAWLAFFEPGQLKFACPDSWRWLDNVEVALGAFWIDARCPIGASAPCEVDVFTFLILVLVFFLLCCLPCCCHPCRWYLPLPGVAVAFQR